ncbi:TPA: hypothetical protein N0F65_001673 [Lagenidium giganteum]|uniref:Uncharacterized protein n=1 Tax=Lagenidium giganteum TaxID=4803 RepID=A0AAV2Z263_9STRA|nr:TPA: hypothetical protein N0F65_001673 [Lagenidium giganteum]
MSEEELNSSDDHYDPFHSDEGDVVSEDDAISQHEFSYSDSTQEKARTLCGANCCQKHCLRDKTAEVEFILNSFDTMPKCCRKTSLLTSL